MKNTKPKRTLALMLALLTLGSQLALPAHATGSEGSGGVSGVQRRGLWLTEIYQNDVKRNTVFSNTSDHMEFVEITNTADTDINFNEGYGLWYEYPDSNKKMVMKQLIVTTVDGSSDNVVIPAGKSAVFWSQRTDLGGTAGTAYATEKQFREAMDVPEDVKVYKVSGQNGFAENDRGFAIKDTDGNTLSYYHYNTTNDEVTADGLSVHLQIPETGSTMQVWQAKKLTSAGITYSAQLSGQRAITAPEDVRPEGLYITEIRPNDSNRNAVYGSAENDLMECLELTNTTDQEINLNQEYELSYRVKEGSYKALPIYQYVANDDPTKCAGLTESCTVPAHSTVVLWCYRAGYGLNQGEHYETFPTMAEFRAAYAIPDEVPVYIFTAQNGLGNTLRGFDLYKKGEGDTKTLVSRYFWDGVSDLKDNKSVDLKVSMEGPLMEVYAAQSTTNMGTVADAQITFPADDGSSPTVALSTSSYDTEALKVLTNGLQQGESLHIPYSYAGTETLPVTYAELFWKTDKMDSYEVFKTTAFAIYNKWYAFIQDGYLQGASSVEYYVRFHNAYRYTQTDPVTVQIHNDAEQIGLRVNFNSTAVSSEPYSGTVQISAKDYRSAAALTFALDGETLASSSSMERGAYFVFDYTGVDSYFKNGLTTGGDTAETGTIIGTFSKCSTLPSDGCLAIPVGQQYFTYNGDGSATIELTLRPATYGSCWEAYTDENNEDFVASNLRLVLRDGTVLTPDTCVGQNITTREIETLNATSSIKIGDSANQYIYVKTTFIIPAGSADAQALALDTTTLSDGLHTLTVTAGDQAQNISFTVQNTEPVEVDVEPTDLTVSLTLSGTGNSTQAQVASVEGAASVSVRKAQSIEDFTVLEGAGDSTSEAATKSDGNTTVSNNGQYPYQLLEIPVTGEEENIRVHLTAEDSYGKDVQLYALNGSTWTLLEVDRDENGQLTALVPVAGYAAGGKVQVLIQARTTAYTPYTQADNFNTELGDNAGWDGTSAPENYDFAIAWYTDTQYYAEQYNNHYVDMVNWIIDNKDVMDIKYVLHTGDIADEFNEEYQFAFARSQQEKLENAGIPTGVLGGNHDVAHGNMVYDLYWKYFGEDYYKDASYYGGSYKNNLGHYDILEVDGEEILIISISWDIYTDEIAWINSVLDEHPGTRAIITTHGGINATADESYTSRILLNGVCKNHPQVIAILNGHYHGSSVNFVELTSDSGETHTIYQICTDYQSAEEGGSGYIKMLYFDLANDKIYLNSYSPSVPGTGNADFNYYDEKTLVFDNTMMSDDGTGTKRYSDYDIDIVTLPVDFDRSTEKALTVSGITVDGLYAEEVGSAAMEGGEAADVTLSGIQSGDSIYAILLDESGSPVGYTNLQTIAGSSNSGGNSGDGIISFAHAVTVPADIENGSVTVSPKSAIQGTTVTITVTPDEGFELDTLTVTDTSSNLTLTNKGNGKYTFTMPDSKVTVSVSFIAVKTDHICLSEKFVDVDTEQWYHEAVDFAVENGMMNGTGATTFEPDAHLSRAMIAQVLYNLEGHPTVSSTAFNDVVDGAWYADAVNWAAEQGIVDGYGNSLFGPGDDITREQMAVILYRYAVFKRYDTAVTGSLSTFTDGTKTASWAKDAMEWAIGSGLISGKGNGILDPTGTATRAEVAQILMNFCRHIAE